MTEERYEDCEDCGERYVGEDAIRSYLHPVAVAGGMQLLDDPCIEDRRRTASHSGEPRICAAELATLVRDYFTAAARADEIRSGRWLNLKGAARTATQKRRLRELAEIEGRLRSAVGA